MALILRKLALEIHHFNGGWRCILIDAFSLLAGTGNYPTIMPSHDNCSGKQALECNGSMSLLRSCNLKDRWWFNIRDFSVIMHIFNRPCLQWLKFSHGSILLSFHLKRWFFSAVNNRECLLPFRFDLIKVERVKLLMAKKPAKGGVFLFISSRASLRVSRDQDELSYSPTAIKCIIFGGLKTETNPRPTTARHTLSYCCCLSQVDECKLKFGITMSA